MRASGAWRSTMLATPESHGSAVCAAGAAPESCATVSTAGASAVGGATVTACPPAGPSASTIEVVANPVASCNSRGASHHNGLTSVPGTTNTTYR